MLAGSSYMEITRPYMQEPIQTSVTSHRSGYFTFPREHFYEVAVLSHGKRFPCRFCFQKNIWILYIYKYWYMFRRTMKFIWYLFETFIGSQNESDFHCPWTHKIVQLLKSITASTECGICWFHCTNSTSKISTGGACHCSILKTTIVWKQFFQNTP